MSLPEILKQLERTNLYLTNANIKLNSIVENTSKTAHHVKNLAMPDELGFSASAIDKIAKRLSSYTGFSYSELRNEILNALDIQTREGEY